MSSVSEQAVPAVEPSLPAVAVEARVQSMSQLLAAVEESTHSGPRAEQHPAAAYEMNLAGARLGLATSLFLALRAKHAPTAAHSLRVAVLASAWLEMLKVPADTRDELEIAALLHDIGKIGIPDHILLKPGKLTAEEQLYMDYQRKITHEIVSGCTTSETLLNVLLHVGTWYTPRGSAAAVHGEAIPFGARLLSIVDAFDSMTTHSLYRTAMSRERAVAELFDKAGTQFDPKLVHEFSHLVTFDNTHLEQATTRRWLGELRRSVGESMWNLGTVQPNEVTVSVESQFHDHLLGDLHDAVIYIDGSGKIVRWNGAAEKLTALRAEVMMQHYWSPQSIGLAPSGGKPFAPEQCPVLRAMCRGERQAGRFEIHRADGTQVEVDAIMSPVVSRSQATLGIALLLRDVSNQVSLERRMQNLHERATRDTLTGVTNRAEFDRLFEQMVREHLASGKPCSLVIADLDYFKRVNDTYGHPAGDEALKMFAALMRKHCRTGDVVARFGGEEFLLLCADCNNATAAARADQIRLELSTMPLAAIHGNCLTASFGVTELQHGDDTDSLLSRADRALLQAKDSGRNQVVQLGAGLVEEAKRSQKGLFASWLHWLNGQDTENLIEQNLVTSVPLNITVEKLRGFIADHQAEIMAINPEHVLIQIDGDKLPLARRSSDRSVPYVVDVQFSTEPGPAQHAGQHLPSRTLLKVTIRPKRGRDRRQAAVQERARQLFASLKSYLVAREIEA